MAFRRRQKKSRTFRRKFKRFNVNIKKMSPRIHSFKRTTEVATYTITDNSTVNNYALNFRLNLLPNYTEFTSLFDAFRICGVKIWFLYTSNSSDTTGAITGARAWDFWIHSIIDHDDSTALSTVADYQQAESYKINKITDRKIGRWIRPKVANAAYAGGAFSGYSEPKRNQWIDAASPAVEHYGFKFGIDCTNLGGVGNYTVGKLQCFATYYIQCKGTR